jgi:hypothetical protein
MEFKSSRELLGGTGAQAVSRRIPGFEPGSVNVGSLVDKTALGQVFSEHFSFPLPVIRLIDLHSSLGAGILGQ